ncbi:MAG: UDP-N-acetylglucosamine 4,6-dehydratase (inverting), partial [Campylobacter sp.]
KDDAHLTYELDDHYVNSPSIKFTSKDDDFSTNALGEKGHLVEENFEYSSDKNKIWLDKDGLLEMIEASK